MRNLTSGYRLTADQAETLNGLIEREWGGQGGPQSALQKLQRAFGAVSTPARGGFSRKMEQVARTVTPQRVTANNRTTADDPLSRIERLMEQRDELIAGLETDLTNQINRLSGAAVGRTARKAVEQDTDQENDQPVRRRKSRKRSNAMKRAWAARKAAETLASKGKGRAKR